MVAIPLYLHMMTTEADVNLDSCLEHAKINISD